MFRAEIRPHAWPSVVVATDGVVSLRFVDASDGVTDTHDKHRLTAAD
jgi:hypothetical protein